ncbi:MAG: endo-1,4-beta-xylanase [Bacteroidota bacterium]|nr:endo-1,4-beta-xylanase [Bacteroidota bacterium]
MRNKIPVLSISLSIAMLCTIVSCKKNDSSGSNPAPVAPPPFDTTATGPLKSGATFNVGLAIDYNQYKNDATYAALVNKEANNVTFGYQMKHGAIVKNDGSFDFSKTDEMVNQATAAGLWIYGHTLTWHQNQNGDYLRSLAAVAGSTDLFAGQNGDFESGSATSFSPYWARLVAAPAAATYEVETASPAQGTRSFKVTVTTLGTNPYDVQMIQNNSPTNNWPGVLGNQYVIKLWAKTSTTNGSFRVINQGTTSSLAPNYDLFPASTWTEYSIPFTCPDNNPTLKFWFNNLGTYWIDNIRIYDATAASPGSQVVIDRVDSALKQWIRASVTRYPGKVKAWDVVNEPYTDGASVLRTGTGTTGDTYYWAEWLGRSYITKAFNYARLYDATSDLFMNDYNLEYNSVKLDSFAALANQLKTQGVPITGVGTQMHININTDKTGIDNMFVKLASTGLKVRVSELDIRINPSNMTGFTATQSQLNDQATMYKYVLQSYYRNVPAAQRYGVTVWGVTDNYSWIVVSQGHEDSPLLFDASYHKKPAYTGLWQGLKQQ